MLLSRRTLLSSCLCVLSWLMGQEVGHAKNSRRATRRRPAFRPRLEPLEDRLAPAGTFVWIGAEGAGGKDWTVAGNWQRTDGDGTYPGATGNDDIAKFTNGPATNDCELNTNLRVKELLLEPFFANKLTVKANHSLTVRSGPFTMQGGKINLEDGSRLNLRSHLHSWTGGTLNNVEGAGGGRIHIYDGGYLTISEFAQQLGATVVIGMNTFLEASEGTLDFAGFGVAGNLNNNVTLYRGADILNHVMGRINFYQTSDSGSKGGIDVEAGQSSLIDNYGRMRRNTVDSGNQTLKIVPPVRGLGVDSLLEVGANCRIEFAGRYIVEGGLYKKHPTARDKGVVGDGGKISIQDPGVAGLYDVYFDDSLTLNNTIVEFDQSTPGAYGRIHVAGDLVISGSTTLALNVNGAQSGDNDSVIVQGTFALTSDNTATLQVTTDNQAPDVDNIYSLIAAGGGIVDDSIDFSAFSWLGYEQEGYQHGYALPPYLISWIYSVKKV